MRLDPSDLFAPASGVVYMDTATYGLAPLPTIEAIRRALSEWHAGTADWIEDWDVVAERARASFARLVDVAPGSVSLIPAASVGVGTVAASLPAGSRVLVAADEFTSLLYPLLVAERQDVAVDERPVDTLVDHIDGRTALVALSLVQMQTGRVADLAAVLDGAAAHGTRVLLDATHGLPFVAANGILQKVDYVVCAAYKHLLCPRGTAFLVVREDRLDDLTPWNANWRGSDRPYERYFGRPLALAKTAARFDTSMAWHLWVGAAPSLELLEAWRMDGTLDTALERARTLASRLGVDWSGSSLVCVTPHDMEGATQALRAGGIKASVRGSSLRFSTHVYTTPSDINRTAEALGR